MDPDDLDPNIKRFIAWLRSLRAISVTARSPRSIIPLPDVTFYILVWVLRPSLKRLRLPQNKSCIRPYFLCFPTRVRLSANPSLFSGGRYDSLQRIRMIGMNKRTIQLGHATRHLVNVSILPYIHAFSIYPFWRTRFVHIICIRVGRDTQRLFIIMIPHTVTLTSHFERVHIKNFV